MLSTLRNHFPKGNEKKQSELKDRDKTKRKKKRWAIKKKSDVYKIHKWKIPTRSPLFGILVYIQFFSISNFVHFHKKK